MNIPQSKEVEYFLELSKSKNFSRAAERLGVTQPTLSLSLKKLEEKMDTSLFVRLKNGIELTQTGVQFLKGASELQEHWESLSQRILNSQEKVEGHYRIGCHPSVALYSLDKFIPQLIKKHPKLSFEFLHSLSRKIEEKLIRFEVDIALVINPYSHPDLVIKKIAQDKVGFYISKKGTHKDTLICDPLLTQSQNLIKKVLKKNLFKRQIHSANLEVIANLAESGAGIALLPERVAKRHALNLFNEKLPTYSDTLCLAYRYDFFKSAASKAIIKSILEAKI